MKVIHILADQRQVDDIRLIKIDESHRIYSVLKTIEQKGVREHEGIQKNADTDRDFISDGRDTIALCNSN